MSCKFFPAGLIQFYSNCNKIRSDIYLDLACFSCSVLTSNACVFIFLKGTKCRTFIAGQLGLISQDVWDFSSICPELCVTWNILSIRPRARGCCESSDGAPVLHQTICLSMRSWHGFFSIITTRPKMGYVCGLLDFYLAHLKSASALKKKTNKYLQM